MTLLILLRRFAALAGLASALAPAHAQSPAEKLEPFDAVRISCSGYPSLEALAPIDSLGVASVPLGKRIVLAGLSIDEAETRLRVLYENQLGLPLRSLKIVRTPNPDAPVRFSGEVENRGLTASSKGLLLSEVLAMARPTDMADLEAVELRFGEELRVIQATGDRTAWDLELRPGDKIFVPRLGRVRQVFVLGAVERPGALDFANGMTAKSAVASAGGATAPGDLAAVEVKREGRLLGVLDFQFGDAPLKVGDTVVVPIRRNAPYILLVGGVARPGRVYFREGLTLQQAIAASGLDRRITKGRVNVVRMERGRFVTRSFELAQILEGSAPPFPLLSGDRIEVPEVPF